MRKINRVVFFIAAFVMFMGYASVPMAFGADDALDAAIRELSDYLNRRIPKGNKAIFLNVKSDWHAFSEYILDCLQENAVNDEVFTVVDRQQLDAIRSELNFQWSGEVSDKSAQEIGQMLGAQTIVSGLVTKVGSNYRIQVRAIAVQTAAVLGLTTKNVSNKGPIVTALTTAPAATPLSDPNAAVDYYKRGDAHFQNGDYDRAIAEFTNALRLDPNNAVFYGVRGVSYFVKNDHDRAIEDFNQCVRFAPNDANGYAMRGMAYNMKNDYDRAITDFEAALRIDPNNALAKEWIVKTRQEQGSNTAAPATPATAAYRIGDTGPAGGLIFYDKGNNNDGWRYLEAAPANTDKEPAMFAADRAFGVVKERRLGAGKENTIMLMEIFNRKGGGVNTAPWICDQLEINGFNDWYQPSLDELLMLYKNIYGKNNSGGFRSVKYWSSTYSPNGGVYTVNFSNGKDGFLFLNERTLVRAVRRF